MFHLFRAMKRVKSDGHKNVYSLTERMKRKWYQQQRKRETVAHQSGLTAELRGS